MEMRRITKTSLNTKRKPKSFNITKRIEIKEHQHQPILIEIGTT